MSFCSHGCLFVDGYKQFSDFQNFVGCQNSETKNVFQDLLSNFEFFLIITWYYFVSPKWLMNDIKSARKYSSRMHTAAYQPYLLRPPDVSTGGGEDPQLNKFEGGPGVMHSEVQCIMSGGPVETPPWTDMSENITFPQLRWRAVIMSSMSSIKRCDTMLICILGRLGVYSNFWKKNNCFGKMCQN